MDTMGTVCLACPMNGFWECRHGYLDMVDPPAAACDVNARATSVPESAGSWVADVTHGAVEDVVEFHQFDAWLAFSVVIGQWRGEATTGSTCATERASQHGNGISDVCG